MKRAKRPHTADFSWRVEIRRDQTILLSELTPWFDFFQAPQRLLIRRHTKTKWCMPWPPFFSTLVTSPYNSGSERLPAEQSCLACVHFFHKRSTDLIAFTDVCSTTICPGAGHGHLRLSILIVQATESRHGSDKVTCKKVMLNTNKIFSLCYLSMAAVQQGPERTRISSCSRFQTLEEF